MKIILYALLLGVALPASAELPEGSANLIKKLEDWELEEQVALQERVFQKRSEVIAVLREQLESANTSGDLEGVVAIKNEIERLNASMSSPEEKKKRWSESDVEATTWRSPNGMLWELEEDGIVYRGRVPTNDRWEISRRGVLTIYFGGFNGSGKIELELDSEIQSGTGLINGAEATFHRLNRVPQQEKEAE